MYRTSSAYKAEMQEYRRLDSYVWVYLGLINRDAQAAASIDAELADFAQEDVFENSRFTGYYATLEQDFFRVDGSMYFLPEDTSYYRTFNQGAVTEDFAGSITFRFNKTIDKFGGLTIDFGEYYPTEFTATNGDVTYTFQNNDTGLFIAVGLFEDSDYITITPTTMLGGDQRMRIHSIMFGIGFQFDNTDLISTKRTNNIDHLSRELPKKTFEFTINNLSQDWTMDNPDSYARALEEMQIVQVTYGRLLKNGSIYKIPSGYMALQSWRSNHSTATFRAVGFLDYSDTTFYRGKVGETTLYDLAVSVFEDMGTTDYRIDTFLKKLTTNNPLPVGTHKECLQMIANAGLCTLYEDGNGIITLKSSMKAPRYTLDIENIEPYSNTEAWLDRSTVYNYATLEKDYFAVDGTLRFFEDITEVHQTGLVSKMYPTDEGLKITIQFEAMWSFVGLTFIFGIVTPQSVTIAEYFDGRVKETNEFEVDDTAFYIDHEFYEMDKLVITFNGTDNQRIHINKMFIGAVNDYTIEERDMRELPTATQTERIRNISIKYYTFIKSTRDLESRVKADEGENLVTFGVPCYDYSISGCRIIESGAYYVIFNSPNEQEVVIKGKEYDKSEQTYTVALRETGHDIQFTNDLISDEDLAERVSEWVSEFYAGEVDYSITYRGEPALESGDRIYLANRFVNSNLILVTSEELTTGQGISTTNAITARQISYIR